MSYEKKDGTVQVLLSYEYKRSTVQALLSYKYKRQHGTGAVELQVQETAQYRCC